jgi:hypothetical protein
MFEDAAAVRSSNCGCISVFSTAAASADGHFMLSDSSQCPAGWRLVREQTRPAL